MRIEVRNKKWEVREEETKRIAFWGRLLTLFFEKWNEIDI